MKKILLAVLLAGACASLAFAQGATVTIQNEEQSTFYYVVDPPDLAQVTPGSPLAATKVAEFFAAPPDQLQFTPLAPGAQASLTGLTDGPHLLVGFFDTEDQDTFPVRLITIQADSSMGERFYSVYGSPALVDATRGVGRLAQFARPSAPAPAEEQAATPPAPAPVPSTPPVGQPAATAAAPQPAATAAEPAPAAPAAAAQAPAAPAPAAPAPIASFSPGYNPVYFTRESKGDFTVLPIASSLTWVLPGTHIGALSAHIDDGVLTVSLTSENSFAPNVSYFIYAFATRAPGAAAAFTLELRPLALPDRGACILWLNGQGTATPMIFGTVKVDGSTATLTAALADEPPAVAQLLSTVGSFDITSCSFDTASGVYEEFYFATVAMADVPVTR